MFDYTWVPLNVTSLVLVTISPSLPALLTAARVPDALRR
jgi:hypothetical protein